MCRTAPLPRSPPVRGSGRMMAFHRRWPAGRKTPAVEKSTPCVSSDVFIRLGEPQTVNDHAGKTHLCSLTLGREGVRLLPRPPHFHFQSSPIHCPMSRLHRSTCLHSVMCLPGPCSLRFPMLAVYWPPPPGLCRSHTTPLCHCPRHHGIHHLPPPAPFGDGGAHLLSGLAPC